MSEQFKYGRVIATYLAVGVGAAGLAGCGKYKDGPKDGTHLSPQGVLTVPGESNGKSGKMYCDDEILVFKTEKNWSDDDTSRYVNQAVCDDGKLTPEDFAVSPGE